MVYSTTTGVSTPTQKAATHLDAIAKMHTAAQFYTRGEIREMEAVRVAEIAAHGCKEINMYGEVCNTILDADLECFNSFAHECI